MRPFSILTAAACSSAFVLAACSHGLPDIPVRTVTYAAQPGGEQGPLIPLRPEKWSWTTVHDPEAMAFASVRDVRDKAARACGVDRLEYDQTGPELIIGSGQTAQLVHARAMLLWCRGYVPQRREGAVLTVRFNMIGDLIWDATVSLYTGNAEPEWRVRTPGTYQMIQTMFTSAGEVVKALSGGREISGDDLLEAWCDKAPVDLNYMPFSIMRLYGEGANAELRGDATQLYAAFGTIDKCGVGDVACEKKHLTPQDALSPPRIWAFASSERNIHPRPGIVPGEQRSIGTSAYWVMENGVPRIRPFTQTWHTTQGTCTAKPVNALIGFTDAEGEAFLKNMSHDYLQDGQESEVCTQLTFEAGVKPISGRVGYFVSLSPSKYGEARLLSSEKYMTDGRVFIMTRISVDRGATPGFTRGCHSTIMN